MLKEHGMRFPTLAEYAASLLPMDHDADVVRVNHQGLFTEQRSDVLMTVESSPGRFGFVPGAEFSPRLYRGQTRFFSPCRPSLFRHKAIDAMFWSAKLYDFAVLLWQHPAMAELLHWELDGLTFDLRIDVFAQHYGYPTVYMDFSRSKDVAMFFATCVFDPATGSYAPASEGIGVLYTVDTQKLLWGPRPVLPLGAEPLPRPDAQVAFAVQMAPGDDLNDMPWASHEEVHLTPALSRKYFDMFDGGRALFPPNPFDAVIDDYRMSQAVSRRAVEMALAHHALPPHPQGLDGAVTSFRAAGYEVQDGGEGVALSVIDAAAADWQERRDACLARVRFRGVADHFQR